MAMALYFRDLKQLLGRHSVALPGQCWPDEAAWSWQARQKSWQIYIVHQSNNELSYLNNWHLYNKDNWKSAASQQLGIVWLTPPPKKPANRQNVIQKGGGSKEKEWHPFQSCCLYYSEERLENNWPEQNHQATSRFCLSFSSRKRQPLVFIWKVVHS